MLKPNLTSGAFKSQKTLEGKQFRTGTLGNALHDTYTDIDAAFLNMERGVKSPTAMSNITDDSTLDSGTQYGATSGFEMVFQFSGLTDGKTQIIVGQIPYAVSFSSYDFIHLDDTSSVTSLTLTVKTADDAAMTTNAVTVFNSDIKQAVGLLRSQIIGAGPVAADKYMELKLVSNGAALPNGLTIIMKGLKTA